MTLEYIRVWILYDLVPAGRPGFVGIGLFFLSGEFISATYGIVQWTAFLRLRLCPFYGLVGLAACLVILHVARIRPGHAQTAGPDPTLEAALPERTRQVQELTQRLILAGKPNGNSFRATCDSVAQTLWYAKMAAENALNNRPEEQEPGTGRIARQSHRRGAHHCLWLAPAGLDQMGVCSGGLQCCKNFLI